MSSLACLLFSVSAKNIPCNRGCVIRLGTIILHNLSLSGAAKVFEYVYNYKLELYVQTWLAATFGFVTQTDVGSFLTSTWLYDSAPAPSSLGFPEHMHTTNYS